MADDKLQKLLQGGIKAAQRGEKDLARKAFLQVLKQEPENEAAWLGVATVAKDNKEKLRALKRLLEINPQNAGARGAVERMGLTPEQVLGASTTAAESVPEDVPVSPFDDSSPAPAFTADPLDDLGEPPLPGANFAPSAEPALTDDDDLSDLGMPPLPGASFAPPAEPALTDDDDLSDLGMPPLPGEDLSDLGMPPLPGAASQSSGTGRLRPLGASTARPMPEADKTPAAKDEDDAAEFGLFDDDSGEDDLYAPEEEAAIVLKTSAEAFREAPAPPRGQNGTPIPDQQRIEKIALEADFIVQTYLEEALAKYADTEWEAKNRGLAGQREYFFFLSQVAAGIITFLIVVGGGTTLAVLNSPAAQRALFAPTWTPSFTPTFTPTATPGVTNTPSPTPELTLTPSPTFAPSVTPGNDDPNIRPEPTDIYLPQGIGIASNAVEQASVLIPQGDLEEAFELLEDDRQGTIASGNFVPVYWLSILQLAQDDPEQARAVVEEGENNWLNSTGRNTNYGPLVEVAYARVDLYEAEQALQEGNTTRANQLLDDAEGRLREVVDPEVGLERFDPEFAEAWVLLSERYLLADDPEQALQVLTDAINSNAGPNLFTDQNIRLQRARVLVDQEQYDAALQELNELLIIEPFQQDALELQVEVAIAKGDPGLAVLYSQQYQLYYPNDVRGFQLLGDARQAENKVDLALNAYSRGLQGNEDEPGYLDILLSRARIFEGQERWEFALDDLTQALDLTGTDTALRVRRMQAAFNAGEFAIAEEDANALLETEGFDDTGAVQLVLGQVLVDTSTGEEDYEDAIALLNQARNSIAPEEQATVDEYLARANFELGDLDDAATQIESALQAEETGSRRYLRGLILETRGREDDNLDDLQEALREYEFILTWSSIFPFEFAEDAANRYEDLQETIEELRVEETS